jgi:uncharacterized protein (DUF1501 family)
MLRRDFLRLTGLSLVANAVPAPLRAEGKAGPIVVLVELKGGNDGLNSLIPFDDPAYYRHRPTLGIPREKVIQLDEKTGFNPVLAPLMAAWKARDLAVVQGVGYPHANRSHFRSIEIWETASDSHAYLDAGWLASLFRPDAGLVDAVVIGAGSSVMEGGGLRCVSMKNAEQFLQRATRMQTGVLLPSSPALRHIVGVERDIKQAADVLADKLAPVVRGTAYGNKAFDRDMALVGRLIRAQVDLQAIKLSLGGFDTHSNQPGRHDNRLRQLAEGLAAFRQEMIAAGQWQRVLLMTYSEFGRRVKENGSRGTDHGKASAHLLMGGQVAGGLYGGRPNLAALDGGDVPFEVDFRSLYTSVAQGWLGKADVQFAGRRFEPLAGILRS